MKSYRDILLTKNATIREALLTIDAGAKKIALVIDNDEKLLGTLTDGDIRRGLLVGLNLHDRIESIIFKNPLVCAMDSNRKKIHELALRKNIDYIPLVDKLGKLIDIVEIDRLLIPTKRKNKVVLMVGGLGTRLRPLTDDTPKPMLTVGDKPILETIILNFKKYGFINIILCVSYKAEKIISYFADGSEFGVNIEYIHEEKRMGTAGALSLIKSGLDEDFFVMNGDLLTNMDFGNMMDYHIRNSAYSTMGVRAYDFQVPYGVVNVEGIDIKTIDEKPVHNFFVSGGIYILNPKVLKFIPKDDFFDMPTLFEKVIEEQLKSISFPIREYWLDIGRIEEFNKANAEYSEVF